MYSSSLANGACAFCWSCSGLKLFFFFFLWSWSWSMSTFCSLCFIFLGRIFFFIFCWVVFGIYFLQSLFWSFMVSVFMWVVVSSESSMAVSTGSMSIGLNLLDNGVGSFISVFCLVWIFSFLREFFLILVVCLTFVWNCWNTFLDYLFCDHF